MQSSVLSWAPLLLLLNPVTGIQTGSEITNKPDTQTEIFWSGILGRPYDLEGYGIVDAVSISGLSLALQPYTTTVQMNSALSFKADKSDTMRYTSASYSLRPLNTIFQVNPSRAAHVSYSVELTVTASISGGQKGDVVLEVSPSDTFAADVHTVAISGLGQTYTLAIALQGVTPATGCVSGIVPAGWYARLRTVNVTGSPTFAVRATQETTL
jgi:hypothetical protein